MYKTSRMVFVRYLMGTGGSATCPYCLAEAVDGADDQCEHFSRFETEPVNNRRVAFFEIAPDREEFGF